MSKASLFAGVYSLLFCIYVWVIIALFLTENHFNPIKDVFDDFFPKLEEFLLQKKNVSHQEEKFNETDETVKEYVENIRAFCPSVMIATLVISVVHAFSTILMLIGISTQKTRGLVIPYIVLQLFVIIILAYGNVLMTLTLPFMPEYATFSTLFWLPILVFIAFVNILLISTKTDFKNPYSLSITFAMFVAIFPTLPIAKLIGFQAIFQFPLPMCLIPVWKDFVNDELEKKDVR